MQVSERVFAHELDAAWIIALWKAIHGGDPAPEAVAVAPIIDRLILALSHHNLYLSKMSNVRLSEATADA